MRHHGPTAANRRSFPTALHLVGVPFVLAAWMLAARLVWEQTLLSWAEGPQMVGFALAHSGLPLLIVPALLGGLLWFVIALIVAVRRRSVGGKAGLALLLASVLAWGLIAAPYGFWQRLFINQFPPGQATEFLAFAAARGDLPTVKAFLDQGVDVNSQNRMGTALHCAVAGGDLEMVGFLIARGADVNAINAYGDSPMAVTPPDERGDAIQALLARHGGTLVRGTDEQHDHVIEEMSRERPERDKPKSRE